MTFFIYWAATDCSLFPGLRSVPLDIEGNRRQLRGVRTLVDFQTTVDILTDPPEGWLYPAVDIFAGLDELSSRLDDGSYDNEYDFQLELFQLIRRAYDYHFLYQPDIVGVISFPRNVSLMSVSVDGSSVPELYDGRDIRVLAASDSTDGAVSPITRINDVPAEDFLREYADINGVNLDPDANYNSMLFNPLSNALGEWRRSPFFQGSETVYEYKNGTVRRETEFASTGNDFSGVVDGQTFFEKFCSGDAPLTLKPVSSNSTVLQGPTIPSNAAPKPPSPTEPVPFTAVPQQTWFPVLENSRFPYPWIVSDDYKVTCYLPEDQPDTAVLAIPSFDVRRSDLQLSFSNTIRSCLATASAEGKQRLILDLRSNGGGTVLLGYDLFKQLFPSLVPWGTTNFRTFPLFNDIGEIVTAAWADVDYSNRPELTRNGTYESIFNANERLDVDLQPFDSWSAFNGPQEAYGSNFTSLTRYNLSDNYQVQLNYGLSGYGDLADIVPEQVFAGENIIMLQDGACGSTCAVFAELAKNQGNVRQVVMGGRAQMGPMQGVGGVKGANVYSSEYLNGLTAEAAALASPEQQAYLQETYATEIETFPYATRRVGRSPESVDGVELLAKVNIRNNIREGDESLTPLQFVYEAADCRLFYTPQMFVQQSLVWQAAYDVIWGGGEGQCVEGSPGQASSGFGVNYFPNGGQAGSEGNGSSSDPEVGPPQPDDNGAATLRVAGLALTVAAMVMAAM